MSSFVYHKGKEEHSDEDFVITDQMIEKRPKEHFNFLLLGSGARECAIAWKLAQSAYLEKLFIAPGNGGTESYGINVPDLKVNDFAAIEQFVEEHYIDIIVVGPEEPLVKGIVDYFAEHKPYLPVIGPSAAAAKIEGSKEFSKGFMHRHAIPTAAYRAFAPDMKEEAFAYLETLKAPYVIKADGLAAGKGVIIAPTMEEAREAVERFFDCAGTNPENHHIVIEEFLQGIECSVFVVSDGDNYLVLPAVKDYKRIGDGDTGPNTGGMGSVSPIVFDDAAFMQKVEERIVIPTLKGLKDEGAEYKGFLFIGLMSVEGDPYVIEYNCRLGDPETQSLMMRIASDLGLMMLQIASKSLNEYTLRIDPRAVATVVLASKGYPGSYKKGYDMQLPIPGEDTVLFHAGTKLENGRLVTDGGRVLCVSSYGSSLEVALERSYTIAQQVLFEGKNYRHDIGRDILELEAQKASSSNI